MTRLVGYTLTMSVLFCAGLALADDAQDARIHFRKAGVKYTEGDIEGALAEYQLAHALSPTFKLRYNIGQCYMELKRNEKAFDAFSKYLSEGGSKVPGDRRTEVEATLASLAEQLDVEAPAPAVAEDSPPQEETEGPPEPEQEVYVPDPRAADLTLEERPADMSERDWFGATRKEMKRYDRLHSSQPELCLTDHLLEVSEESKLLMWGEIAAGILTGAGVALGVTGWGIGNEPLQTAGAGGAAFFGLGLIAMIIVDVINIKGADVIYDDRLEKEQQQKQAAGEAWQPGSCPGSTAEAPAAAVADDGEPADPEEGDEFDTLDEESAPEVDPLTASE